MRDKNQISLFNFQVEKVIQQVLLDEKFLTRPVLDTPTLLQDSEWKIIYPRSFREIRSLSIALWSFPDFLKWRILLDLNEKEFRNFTLKQRLELKLYLTSKEVCYSYFRRTRRISSNEKFGNILQNDLRRALFHLKFLRNKLSSPRKLVRRRGYKDKGSRRFSHQWLPKEDFSLTLKQNKKEKETYLLLKSYHFLLKILRE